MKIAVAGLVIGLCLAEVGHTVICVDIDEKKVKLMESGISPYLRGRPGRINEEEL